MAAGIVGLFAFGIGLVAVVVTAVSQSSGSFQFAAAIVPPLVLLVMTAIAAFIVYAAAGLLRLRGYVQGIVASILAMLILPCLGVPFGIWTLVVLSRRDVKDAFATQSQAPAAAPPSPPQVPAAAQAPLPSADRDVQGPAIGLLITGILNWVLIPLLLIPIMFLLYLGPPSTLRPGWIWASKPTPTPSSNQPSPTKPSSSPSPSPSSPSAVSPSSPPSA